MSEKSQSLLTALRDSLVRAARHNPDDMAKPQAVLWTDADEEWLPLVPQLRKLMPELLTCGEYQPERGSGPSIWLRCVIEGVLPDFPLPLERTPVIYLPGKSRQELRAGQECPEPLKPLVELQYRGTCWTQRNGKDWTVEAFLVSGDGGLGLDVARDSATRRSLHAALSELAIAPISRLSGRRLEAEDFDRLLTEDTVKDLLVWLAQPDAKKKEWSGARWSAFASRCAAEYRFDPERDGEIVGAELLARRDSAWGNVWERFAEAPELYPAIPELLRRAKPANQELFADPSPWPQSNEEMEARLRDALLGLRDASQARAREVLRALEQEHGERRGWVWAKLGWAPLAESLQHVAEVAAYTFTPVGGASAEDIASNYSGGAFKADLAVMDALAAVKSTADLAAVVAALRSLYLPWLDASARHLQQALDTHSLQGPGGPLEPGSPVTVEAGGVILFADGLRFDIGNLLAARMKDRGWGVALESRWAALPTVTATAKPAVSPVAGALSAEHAGEDFLPQVADSRRELTTDRFRKLLAASGYQYLESGETGDPSGRGWTEHGELDRLGHLLQAKLAARMPEQLDLLIERVQSLLDAGWREVRIVSDHGWLLVPGALPKVDLPKYLTRSRWARCAVIRGASTVEVPTVPWRWNEWERIAVAPGISCFEQGYEYAHGGISLEECLVPDIRVSIGKGKAMPQVGIAQIKWLGLRCHLSIEPAHVGLAADIRAKTNDPASSLVTPAPFDEEGRARLLVTDDDLMGSPVVVVVVDGSGRVVAKQPTIVGGGEE